MSAENIDASKIIEDYLAEAKLEGSLPLFVTTGEPLAISIAVVGSQRAVMINVPIPGQGDILESFGRLLARKQSEQLIQILQEVQDEMKEEKEQEATNG